MSSESTALAPQEGRHFTGWIVLGGLFFLLITNQIQGYFNRSTSSVMAVTHAIGELRREIGLEAVAHAAGRGPMVRQSLPLSNEATSLLPFAMKDPTSAKAYVVTQTQAGQALDPRVINLFRISMKPDHQAYYRIYSQPQITEAEVRRDEEVLSSSDFVDRLAIAQAKEKAHMPDARSGLSAGIYTKSPVAFAGASCILFMGGLVAIGMFLTLRGSGNLKPLGLPLGQITLEDADGLAIRAALLVSLLFFAPPLLSSLHLPLTYEASGLIGHLVLAAGTVLLAGIAIKGKKFDLASLGISKAKLGTHVCWALGGWLANLPLLFAVSFVSQKIFSGLPEAVHPLSIDMGRGVNGFAIFAIFVSACILAPFIEEILFRGTFLPALSRVFKSPVAGALVSSLLFAAIHPTGIPAWPGLATIAGMSCLLTYQTKSLVPSILFHALNNLGVLLITLLTT